MNKQFKELIDAIQNDRKLTSIQSRALETLDSFINFSGKRGENIPAIIPANAVVLKPANAHKIKSGEFRNFDFTEVIIPDTVTEISTKAFMNCKNLTKITLSTKLNRLGAAAFKGCSNLESIIMPDKVRVIEKECFSKCISLTDVTLPKGLKEIQGAAFNGCTSLESIEIPEGVIAIQDSVWVGDGEIGVFDNCINLITVKLPTTLKLIGMHAFYECTRLATIEIPDSVIEIGWYAFYGCERFKAQNGILKLPESLTDIGNSAFGGCPNIKKVIFPKDIKEINGFDRCSNLTTIEYPRSNTLKIGRDAFSYSFSLINQYGALILPENVTMIYIDAFKGLWGLKSVILPQGIEYLSGFSDCRRLKCIDIPNSVYTIGFSAFKGCEGLTAVKIPDSVSTIDYHAFEGCTGLTSIEIPNSVNEIGLCAFKGCNDLHLSRCQIA